MAAISIAYTLAHLFPKQMRYQAAPLPESRFPYFSGVPMASANLPSGTERQRTAPSGTQSPAKVTQWIHGVF